MVIYPLTASSGYFQGLYPTLFSIPNKLGGLWENFLSSIGSLLRPLRPLTDRIFFLSWRTTALLSTAIVIAVHIDNHYHSKRNTKQAETIESLQKLLKTEEAKGDHASCKAQLSAAIVNLESWKRLYNAVCIDLSKEREKYNALSKEHDKYNLLLKELDAKKQKLQTELQSELNLILKSLIELSKVLMGEVARLPAKETSKAFQEIQKLVEENSEKTSRLILTTSTPEFILVNDPLGEISSNIVVLQTKIDQTLDLVTELEKTKLRDINKFIGQSSALILEKQQQINTLLSRGT